MLVATTRSQQILIVCHHKGLLLAPCGSDGKASAYNVGEPGSIPDRKDLLERATATHSSILAWKIPWTEEPGRLQSMGSQRVIKALPTHAET